MQIPSHINFLPNRIICCMFWIINSLGYPDIFCVFVFVAFLGLINVKHLRIEDRLADLNNKPIDVSIV